jgi:hypothetical protein
MMKVSFCAWLLLVALVAGCGTGAPSSVIQPVPSTAAPAPAVAPGSPASPGTQAPPTFAGLTVEEYAVPGDKDMPIMVGPEGGKLPDVRAKWRGTTASWVEAINQSLAPFGYRVTLVDDPNVGHPVYTVAKGDAVVVADADRIWPPSINSRGDDFLMVVERAGQNQVLSRGKAEAWDAGAHRYTVPVFAGDRIVTVVNESQQAQSGRSQYRYSVMSGNEKLFSDQFQWEWTDDPIKRLSAWDGHWVLEVSGHVVIDGEDFGSKHGYTEVFGWQLLAGKPFYYAVKDGKTSIVYGDQVFPTQYDTVVHYRCCSPAMYNNWGNEQMATFFGQRDGRWYYVEIGRYE